MCVSVYVHVCVCVPVYACIFVCVYVCMCVFKVLINNCATFLFPVNAWGKEELVTVIQNNFSHLVPNENKWLRKVISLTD